jgi:hypothetical protein
MWIWLLCATLRYIFGIGVCINDDQQLPRHPGHGDFHLRALSRQAAAENPRAKVHTPSATAATVPVAHFASPFHDT